MRRMTGILALACALLFASPFADACGDKLLSIARGIRLNQTYKARYPAAILMYVGDVSVAKTSKKEHKRLVQMSILYMSLRQAGHHLEAVQTTEELQEAMAKKRFDFVMSDLDQVGDVIVPVVGGATKTEILPVMFKPKKKNFAAAQEQYELVLKTPATSVNHLEAIDEAMEPRALATSSSH